MAMLKKHKITQHEFGQAAGISDDQIGRWKKTGAPKHAAVCISAVLFGLRPWEPPDARMTGRL